MRPAVAIHEPDVVLTDVVLALVALTLSFYLKRRVGRLPAIIFGAVASASLLGALFHAFFPQKTATLPGFALWMAVALSIGIGAAALLIEALRMIFATLGKRQERLIAFTYLGSYLAAMILIDHSYRTVVAFYMPAFLVFLLVSLYRAWGRRSGGHGMLAAGILLSVVAAGLQRSGFSLPQLSLSHNAVYHLVQAAGLLVLARGFVLART